MDRYVPTADLDDWDDEEEWQDEILDEELYDDFEDEEDDEAYDELVDLGDAFRSVLHEDYVEHLSPEETDEVLFDMVESLPPDEAFSLVNALGSIAKPVAKAATSKELRSIAGAALPIAAPALGTALGGPLGGLAAQSLAGAAQQALAGKPKAVAAKPTATLAAPAPATAFSTPSPATPTAMVAQLLGQLPQSAQFLNQPQIAQLLGQLPQAQAVAGVADQALKFAQQPAVRQAMVAKALGPFGAQMVADIPVDRVLGTLAALVGGSVPTTAIPATAIPATALLPTAEVAEELDDTDDVPAHLFGEEDEYESFEDEGVREIYEKLCGRFQPKAEVA